MVPPFLPHQLPLSALQRKTCHLRNPRPFQVPVYIKEYKKIAGDSGLGGEEGTEEESEVSHEDTSRLQEEHKQGRRLR